MPPPPSLLLPSLLSSVLRGWRGPVQGCVANGDGGGQSYYIGAPQNLPPIWRCPVLGLPFVLKSRDQCSWVLAPVPASETQHLLDRNFEGDAATDDGRYLMLTTSAKEVLEEANRVCRADDAIYRALEAVK
eukprot:1713323-Pyramimonas_sp.AAC.1